MQSSRSIRPGRVVTLLMTMDSASIRGRRLNLSRMGASEPVPSDLESRDPAAWVNEPVRRALDGVLYRWLALFAASVMAAVAHKIANDGPIDRLVHIGLPLFLVGYVMVHLAGRLWRRRGDPGGWRQARDVDRGTLLLARSVGWVALFGGALAVIATLGTLGEPRQMLMEILLWTPLMLPLYSLAVWVTLDCAEHRLGRGVEESRRRVDLYWRHVAGRAGSRV